MRNSELKDMVNYAVYKVYGDKADKLSIEEANEIAEIIAAELKNWTR